MDQRGDGEAEVEDEFACAGMLRGSLTSLHDSVERIFQVTFSIGADDLPQGNNGQIWLKLCGTSKNVEAAKLFVKGIVNQEAQHEVSYPKVLHCIFCGAKGLFMDCLIKNTSAHVMVASPGYLLISGLAEPVVQAFSLITELVKRYEGTRHSETGDRGSNESLESRRAFKTMVEKREDRHILDLLVLPCWVKEILLDFVKESGLDSNSDLEVREDNSRSQDQTSQMNANFRPFITADCEDEETAAVLRTKSTSKNFSSSAANKQKHFPAHRQIVTPKMREVGDKQKLSAGNKEFCLLLKFFTAMGYTESVVNRVLARTGPKEASQILDLVQQEQDHSDQEQVLQGFPDMRGENNNTLNENTRNGPCETEHKEDLEAASAKQDLAMMTSNGKVHENMEGRSSGEPEGGSDEEKENGNEEDFVLGVVKKAAASCGYSEQKVAEVYGTIANRSTHKLLLELQREENQGAHSLREGPRETDDVVVEKKNNFKVVSGQVKEHIDSDDDGGVELPASVSGPVLFPRMTTPQRLSVSQCIPQPKEHQVSDAHMPQQSIQSDIKGPPMTLYPSFRNGPHAPNIPTKAHFDQSIQVTNPIMLKQKHSSQDNINNHLPSNSGKKVPHTPDMIRNHSPPNRTRHQLGSTPDSTVVVTGKQRFLEGLQTPFDLKLIDTPGVKELKAIIIDGSNVAMSHGLGYFFSCRGIALAVQHFWDRGHREIRVLVPEWRKRNDPKIKEKHFLSKLSEPGLLCYTPSREVQGKRISSYDDRMMLQLAKINNGVIVTNDNLRDLFDESEEWTDIIKKRLLQYTFVGDHFMVPDDPLGYGGPHLDDFLRSEPRISEPARRTFTGITSTTSSSSEPPPSHAEISNFYDQAVYGNQLNRGSKDKGGKRGHGKGWQSGNQHLNKAGPQRNSEFTARLREQLCQMFPGQDEEIALVLQCHPTETDICVLTDKILELQTD